MKYNISFQEMSRLGEEQLSKQRPFTYEEAKRQVDLQRSLTKSNNTKRKRPNEHKNRKNSRPN